MITFVRRIKGREDALSITIPKSITDDYGITSGDYVKVTLKKVPKDKEEIIFAKRVAKCGSEGTLIYIPKQIVRKYGLNRNMSFWVTIKYIEEVL